ncbi:hypothetical protein NEPAR04_1665 [Nematocida parisii]|nr:hypothetical protein NEPAR08_0543 [Nematocida parisii]KAI5127907.1 hypothetical protein NEPAR03_1187 [Nematocida parisii]KAI5142845.1 hypothetical protein NEPAR04_1665 [Nematocida parisii]
MRTINCFNQKKIIMRMRILSISIITLFFPLYTLRMNSKETKEINASSFYSIKDVAIDGSEVDFTRFKGEVSLIVNTACTCGLAKEGFETIRKLQEEFKDLNVLLFPSALSKIINQEKNTPKEILQEIKKANITVGGRVVVFNKRVIDSSKGIFDWLTRNYEKTGWLNIKAIKWNFTMFVVDRTGTKVVRHDPLAAKYPEVKKTIEKFYTTELPNSSK